MTTTNRRENHLLACEMEVLMELPYCGNWLPMESRYIVRHAERSAAMQKVCLMNCLKYLGYDETREFCKVNDVDILDIVADLKLQYDLFDGSYLCKRHRESYGTMVDLLWDVPKEIWEVRRKHVAALMRELFDVQTTRGRRECLMHD